MSFVVLLIIGIVCGGASSAALFFLGSKAGGEAQVGLAKLSEQLDARDKLVEDIESLYDQMVDLGTMRSAIAELRSLEEGLKAERGRITITHAEVETVETRLRELEEIERELEASGIETKEELNILRKKQAELTAKNDALLKRIEDSTAQLEQLFQEVEMSTQMQEQVIAMKTQLLQTQEKIGLLIEQVEQGNEQYFILKQRYDALDIEYAQLYEKFAEVEGAKDGED